MSFMEHFKLGVHDLMYEELCLKLNCIHDHVYMIWEENELMV